MLVEHPPSVALVVLDRDDLVLVRQWRPGAGAVTLELPSGTLEEGESPLECAQRELAEECGLRASGWRELGSFLAAPSYSTERVHVFAAFADGEATGQPDEDEAIEVQRVPVGSATWALSDGISLGALALWRLGG